MVDVNTLFYALTVFSQIFLLVLLGLYIFKRKLLKKIFSKHNLKFKILTFIVPLTATLGSLFYSEIAGYNPCVLCWYQRIFMYPLPIILGLSIYFKDKIKKYVIALASIGAVIALYHYLVQLSSKFSCSVAGVDCGYKYTFGLGYITIPMMALTAFILTIVLIYLYEK